MFIPETWRKRPQVTATDRETRSIAIGRELKTQTTVRNLWMVGPYDWLLFGTLAQVGVSGDRRTWTDVWASNVVGEQKELTTSSSQIREFVHDVTKMMKQYRRVKFIFGIWALLS